MRIYVASSWRNQTQPYVVQALRGAGFSVYDFRNPSEGDAGFSWTEIKPDYPPGEEAVLPASEFRELLGHGTAQDGFDKDRAALVSAQAGVLVLPCGRSAHLEAGFLVGLGKPTAVLLEDPLRPELMYKLAAEVCVDLEELLDWAQELEAAQLRG